MKIEITDEDMFCADSLKVAFIVNQYMAVIDAFLSRSKERGGKCGQNNCLNNIVQAMLKSNRGNAVRIALGVLDDIEVTQKIIGKSLGSTEMKPDAGCEKRGIAD